MLPIIVTLDVSTIGATTLREIRKSLCKEITANNPNRKGLRDDKYAYERVILRRQETQLLNAVNQIDKVFHAYGVDPIVKRTYTRRK